MGALHAVGALATEIVLVWHRATSSLGIEAGNWLTSQQTSVVDDALAATRLMVEARSSKLKAWSPTSSKIEPSLSRREVRRQRRRRRRRADVGTESADG